MSPWREDHALYAYWHHGIRFKWIKMKNRNFVVEMPEIGKPMSWDVLDSWSALFGRCLDSRRHFDEKGLFVGNHATSDTNVVYYIHSNVIFDRPNRYWYFLTLPIPKVPLLPVKRPLIFLRLCPLSICPLFHSMRQNLICFWPIVT